MKDHGHYGVRNVILIICALALVGMIAVSSSLSVTALAGTALLQAGSVEPPRDLGSGFLQGGNEFGLGYNLDNGKAAQAAEDPFNHKPLLKEDPNHPGKVVLTQDAIQRRKNVTQAYQDFIKRHPRVFNPVSKLSWQDASKDPVASKIHDTGAYDLEQAGVKV